MVPNKLLRQMLKTNNVLSNIGNILNQSTPPALARTRFRQPPSQPSAPIRIENVSDLARRQSYVQQSSSHCSSRGIHCRFIHKRRGTNVGNTEQQQQHGDLERAVSFGSPVHQEGR
jgi:hypothetical protein